ncbi:SapC family protein [Piscinibacter sp.]|uniref:SapC family protein n=1 Tax=Piscinibacter sp. TaxID=1903157 RepID=UPI002C49CE23|nr:SapC family protein [Albitalea sp.]HUG26408.1 SapC family protein [Albitalea sp.]
MINSALYREPQLLDSVLHRHKKLQKLSDFSITQGMHAVYLTATEFPQAALEFPIIFVNTGERSEAGKPVVAPVVMLGLAANENLRLNGARWDAGYVPAFIRRFPFLTAAVKGADAPAVFIDAAWSGVSDTEGEPLFDAEGQPTGTLKNMIAFLERFDAEQRRTRAMCSRLVELDLLKDMQADAAMPNGVNLKVEGFLAIDEDKLGALSDEATLELHRSGIMMLLHAHLLSLPNIKQLVERKAVRVMAKAGPSGPTPTPPPKA